MPLQVVGRMVLDRWPDNFFAETEQVAFCTRQHRARHRLHQRSAAAGPHCSPTSTRSSRGWAAPNFHQIPINAPKCPFAQLPADGHMQMAQPEGRVNYEPNSLAGETRPREDAGARLPQRCRCRGRARSGASAPRASPTTTARRGSSIVSQTPLEQAHIASALVFELSKVGARARPRGDGRPPAPHRRGPGQAGRRRPRRSTSCPRRRRPRRPCRTWSRRRRCSIIGKMKDTLAGPRGRHPDRRRLGRRGRRGDPEGRRPRRAPTVKIVAPKVGGATLADGSHAGGRRPAGRHAVGAVRRRRRHPLGRRAPALLSGERGDRFRARRLRSPQGHRRRRRRPRRC